MERCKKNYLERHSGKRLFTTILLGVKKMCSRPDDMKEYWKGEEMEIRPFLEVIDTNFQEREDEEDMKWNVQGIADENCINCERYKEDIYVSPCICEVVMDIIHRNCEVRNQEDEDFCANEWGKHRKKILTRLLRS